MANAPNQVDTLFGTKAVVFLKSWANKVSTLLGFPRESAASRRKVYSAAVVVGPKIWASLLAHFLIGMDFQRFSLKGRNQVTAGDHLDFHLL